MQAAILAGGLGTRLGPITKEVPKPMVKIAGKPYLEYQLEILRDQSIRHIVLLTGYLGDQIEAYFGNGERLGMSIRYSREQTPLGTGGALRDAASMLADSFLVIYGDSYLPLDYLSVLHDLEASSAVGLVVAYDNRLGDTSVTNNLAVDADGVVAMYQKDAPDNGGASHVEAGVLAFRRNVLDLIPERGAVSLEREVFPELIARRSLRAYITRRRFYDIGTPERLRTIERMFNHDYHANAISD
jgi:NDP-sugar pyrophosphorylase family protein